MKSVGPGTLTVVVVVVMVGAIRSSSSSIWKRLFVLLGCSTVKSPSLRGGTGKRARPPRPVEGATSAVPSDGYLPPGGLLLPGARPGGPAPHWPGGAGRRTARRDPFLQRLDLE